MQILNFTDSGSENFESNDTSAKLGALNNLTSSLIGLDTNDHVVTREQDFHTTPYNVADIFKNNSLIIPLPVDDSDDDKEIDGITSLSDFPENYTHSATIIFNSSTEITSAASTTIENEIKKILAKSPSTPISPLLTTKSNLDNVDSEMANKTLTSVPYTILDDDGASDAINHSTDILPSLNTSFIDFSEVNGIEYNNTDDISADDISNVHSTKGSVFSQTTEVFTTLFSQDNVTMSTTQDFSTLADDNNTTVRKLFVGAMPTPDTNDTNYEEFVEEVQYMAYSIFFPILIFMGLILNTLCLIVLLKPRMRSMNVNKYFLAIAISDLMVCLTNIPIAVTTNGCYTPSYGAVVYYGYFGWTMIGIWQALSFYTILFLSYDKYLAVWHPQRFKRQNTGTVFRNRIIITVVVDVLMHLGGFINVEIKYIDNTKSLEECDPSRYVIKDSLRTNANNLWHKIFYLFYEVVKLWLPGLLLVIFNAGLVSAIAMGRLTNPASSHRNKERMEFRIATTVIGITCSFLICTIPESTYFVGFNKHIDNKCYGNYELFRVISNNLKLFQHVIHIGFLVFLNPSFRRELLNLLTCRRLPDPQSDENQSSRDLQMNQVNRQSGHSPFPNKSPSHSPYTNRISASQTVESVSALAPLNPII